MEGDREIAKIIYTNGDYSIFDEVGEEHLFNASGVEMDLEEDPSWSDGDDMSSADDGVVNLHRIGCEEEEEAEEGPIRRKKK